MRSKTLIVATIAFIALGACSTNTDTSTPHATADNPAGAGPTAKAGTVQPCSLLTTDQATAVLGEPATVSAPHSFQNTVQCEWDSADGSVAILVYIGGQKVKWQTTHDQAKSAYSAKFMDVPGLGDAAFSNGIDVHVLQGDDMYQIGVIGPFQDQIKRAITVAKEALAQAR